VIKVPEGLFWNKSVETAPLEELRALQSRLLREQVKGAYERSKFYREKFEEARLHPSDIRDLGDVAKIPFTSREELEGNFEDALLFPLSRVGTIRQTSGTTGPPLTVAYSRGDIERIGEASARKLTYHGVTAEDVVQVTASYGLWQGAWSIHWGLEKIGACEIPTGPGNTEGQIRVMKRFGTTVLYGVTNYHFRIAEVAKQLGENLRDSSLRVGICVAEKPTERQMEGLREEFGYETVAIDYGATEFPGFSVHCCSDLDAHHVWADYYLVEIVDPETREPLHEGERGELVITSLQREAFPLIRYLSKDITDYLGFERCGCGLTHPKIGVDIDRKDFMVKIRGVPVFPSRLEFILRDFRELSGRAQILVDKRTPRQEVTLKVEERERLPEATRELLRQKIQREVKGDIGVTLNEVLFVPFGAFGEKMRKSITIE